MAAIKSEYILNVIDPKMSYGPGSIIKRTIEMGAEEVKGIQSACVEEVGFSIKTNSGIISVPKSLVTTCIIELTKKENEV